MCNARKHAWRGGPLQVRNGEFGVERMRFESDRARRRLPERRQPQSRLQLAKFAWLAPDSDTVDSQQPHVRLAYSKFST